MALSRSEKESAVNTVKELLESSKLTVIADYQGTTVRDFQDLRRQAKESGTTVKVVKNRLFIKALEGGERFKDIDSSILTNQLAYAFNSEDEVAPAQALANFKKSHPNIKLIGAITAEGQLIGSDDVQALANLPSKDQLRAQLVGTIGAPLSGFVNVLSGNVRGVLNVLNARAENI